LRLCFDYANTRYSENSPIKRYGRAFTPLQESSYAERFYTKQRRSRDRMRGLLSFQTFLVWELWAI
jgi:hypothetical protein